MKPLVVTRVAVSQFGEPSTEWVEERVGMLTRVTAPSILATGVPWVWRTCQSRFDQVAEIAAMFDPEPVVVDEHTVTDERVWPGDNGPFLTFRVDSDDAYLPDALTADYPVVPDGVVSFDEGWQLEWASRAVAPRRYPSGPFLAVCHDGRDAMLDVGGHHGRVRRHRTVHRVETPSWVQTCHDGNLSTSWQRKPPLPPHTAATVLERASIEW